MKKLTKESFVSKRLVSFVLILAIAAAFAPNAAAQFSSTITSVQILTQTSNYSYSITSTTTSYVTTSGTHTGELPFSYASVDLPPAASSACSVDYKELQAVTGVTMIGDLREELVSVTSPAATYSFFILSDSQWRSYFSGPSSSLCSPAENLLSAGRIDGHVIYHLNFVFPADGTYYLLFVNWSATDPITLIFLSPNGSIGPKFVYYGAQTISSELTSTVVLPSTTILTQTSTTLLTQVSMLPSGDTTNVMLIAAILISLAAVLWILIRRKGGKPQIVRRKSRKSTHTSLRNPVELP